MSDSVNPRRRALRRCALVGLPVAALAAVLVGTGAAAATLHAFGLADVSAPSNDSFASAAPVGAGSFDGTTAGATTEAAEVSAGQAAAGDRSVWFSWTPAHGGEAVISGVGDRSPRVRVFTGSSVSALARVDTGASGAVSVPVLAGSDYRIQVLDTGDGGDFSEALTQPDGTGPDNDGFAAPVNLNHAIDGQLAGTTGPLLTGTTAGATVEDGEPGSPDHTVWYSYVTPPGTGAAGTLTLTAAATQPVGAALTLEAFTGTAVPTLSSVAGPAAGPLSITVAHGVTYLVRVSGPEAYFSLTAGLVGVSGPDTTPPVITCGPAPTGWVKTLSVPCTASDAASGLASAGDASFALSAAVPPGTTAPGVTTPSRSVCDVAGNCADAPVITADVDTQAPSVVCGTPPGDWTSAAVTVTCQASDAGSGLVGPASFDRTADVPAGSFGPASFPAVPAVCDTAGNCTDVPAVADVRIDRTPPVVTCAPAPGSGWVKDEVSIACTATDTGSGLASPADASTTLATSVGAGAVDGVAATDSVPICDLAGNCTTAGPVTGLQVDRSVPVVSCPDDATWHAGTSATVTCTVTDDGSGLVGAASLVLRATIPAGTETDTATTGTSSVCDVAGNCTTAGPVSSVRLDDKPPAVSCQGTPSRWLDTAADVTCSVLDAGSGVPSPTVDLTADVAPGAASSAVPVSGRQVCDAVGNCTPTPSLAPAAIDRRTPSVTCAAPPPGVVNYEVTVTCTAGDPDSGLADPADASFTLGTSVGPGGVDHAAPTSTHRVCDLAGNCVVAGPLTADVDRSVAPSIAAPGADGALACDGDRRRARRRGRHARRPRPGALCAAGVGLRWCRPGRPRLRSGIRRTFPDGYDAGLLRCDRQCRPHGDGVVPRRGDAGCGRRRRRAGARRVDRHGERAGLLGLIAGRGRARRLRRRLGDRLL